MQHSLWGPAGPGPPTCHSQQSSPAARCRWQSQRHPAAACPRWGLTPGRSLPGPAGGPGRGRGHCGIGSGSPSGGTVGELGVLPGMFLSGPQLGVWRAFRVILPFPSSPFSPLYTHQLQGLAGAAAQGSLGDAQRVSEQHQLLRVAQLVGGALRTGRTPGEGDLIGTGCSSFPSPPHLRSSPAARSCEASQPH